MRSSLDLLFQIGAWLVAIIILFVVKPPRLTPSDDGMLFVRAAQFVVAILLALAIVAIRRGRMRLRTIWSASLAIVLSAVIALFSYRWLSSIWTCDYDGRGDVVIGRTMLPDAAAYARSLKRSECDILIQNVAGDTASIWPKSELVFHHLALSGLFMTTVILFAVSAVLAAEVLRQSDAR